MLLSLVEVMVFVIAAVVALVVVVVKTEQGPLALFFISAVAFLLHQCILAASFGAVIAAHQGDTIFAMQCEVMCGCLGCMMPHLMAACCGCALCIGSCCSCHVMLLIHHHWLVVADDVEVSFDAASG
jgi:hypothetical protein